MTFLDIALYPAKIPSEATFSRAVGNLGKRVHDELVEQYLAEELVGHISRDSTAIVGRDKPAKKKAKEPKKPHKRGRPTKGEQREPAEEKFGVIALFADQLQRLLV